MDEVLSERLGVNMAIRAMVSFLNWGIIYRANINNCKWAIYKGLSPTDSISVSFFIFCCLMMRQIVTFHLAAILLLSNVGIPVFTHICHGQGKTWTSLYVPAKSCCTKKKLSTNSFACHIPAKDNDSSSIKSRPCCENKDGLIQLDSDFAQKLPVFIKWSQTSLIFAVSLINQSLPGFLERESYSINKPHGPPIQLHGRSLLISQQVFRC